MKFKLPQFKFKSERLKELSKKFLQDKDEKLLKDVQTLVEQNPQDMRLRQKLAEVYYKRNLVDEAVTTFREIAANYEKEDFTLKAIDMYKNILKIKPDLVDVNLKLSTLYIKVDMRTEAANQLRIAINYFARQKDSERTLALAEQLVKVDPSPENRAKMAEIYQLSGMADEAVKQYEMLAKEARLKKNHDKLLHYYEMILPHRPNNTAIIKDVCILYLRKKHPERALQIMEHYKMSQDPVFGDLAQKARLMMEALKRQKKLA